MTASPCSNLEAYLNRELASADRSAFVRHLDECEICQSHVVEDARMTELLRMATSVKFRTRTYELADRSIRKTIGRQRMVVRVGAIAAIVLLGVFIRVFDSVPESADQRVVDTAVDANDRNDPILEPVLVQASEDMIVVPTDRVSDDFTIVLLYQTSVSSEEIVTDQELCSLTNQPY